MRAFERDGIRVFVGESTEEMARKAAEDVAQAVGEVLAETDEVNIVFAAAESQQAFHRALRDAPGIEWSQVNAFAVDDFHAPGIPAELAVAAQIRRDLHSHVNPKSVHEVDFAAPDAEAERARYEALIRANPPDIACLGIGRSGHLALNEPGGTDFNDPWTVRVVEICAESRQQLLDDPNFQALGTIPERGITLTIPAIVSIPRVFLIVPLKSKAPVMKRFFESDVTPDLPASILKAKDNVRLYLDAGSFGQ